MTLPTWTIDPHLEIITEIEEIIAKLHLTTPGAQQPKESKFPIWGQGKSWELYKEEIRIFEKGTIKKPITKFQDLIAALISHRKQYAPFYINKYRVVGLVDSGADMSCMHDTLLQKILPKSKWKFDRCCTRQWLIFNWGCRRRCLFHNGGGYVVFVVCPVKTFITIALLDLKMKFIVLLCLTLAGPISLLLETQKLFKDCSRNLKCWVDILFR